MRRFYSAMVGLAALVAPMNASALVFGDFSLSTLLDPTARVEHIYEVKRGDTLWEIARKHYGTPLQWDDIARANNIADPRKMREGTILTLPPRVEQPRYGGNCRQIDYGGYVVEMGSCGLLVTF